MLMEIASVDAWNKTKTLLAIEAFIEVDRAWENRKESMRMLSHH
jgi:hypothetical protein